MVPEDSDSPIKPPVLLQAEWYFGRRQRRALVVPDERQPSVTRFRDSANASLPGMSTRTQRWPIIGIAPRQFVGDGRHGNKHRTVEIAQLDALLNALRPIVVGQRRLANRHQIHLASTKQGLGLLAGDDGT